MGPSSKPPPLRWLAEILGLRLEIKRIVESDETYTRESADHKVQWVYTNAVRKLPDYTPHPDGMKPWLLTITRNVMSDAHRDTKRHERVFEPDDGHVDTAETPEVSPERAAELKQALEKVTAALRDMPPSQAAVLWMVCVEDRSHEEAGAALGISEDAAKMALSRARENLRARFGNTLFTGPHPVLALLSDCVPLLGHLWAFLMAMLFASFAVSPREPDNELPAVATDVAHIVAASAADVAHAGLTAPPAQCDPCECQEATEQCSGVPGDITIGAGMCGAVGAPSLPFDGPGGWNGSCTDANALPAGAQCPPGSGVLCAQSITFSALPPPANEKCDVKPSQIIKVSGTKITEWETGALACRSSLDTSLCGEGAQLCVPKVHYPHRQCVWQKGKHTKCPKPYDHEGPRIMYPFQPKESRDCTECTCGAPQGGMCVATVRLFDNGVCSGGFHQRIVTSEDSPCDPILPAGRAIGGKSVTEHVYVKGTCEAGGGEPIGEAVEDEENAVTFCCRPSYMFDE